MNRLWLLLIAVICIAVSCDESDPIEEPGNAVEPETVTRVSFGCGEYWYVDIDVPDYNTRTWHWLVLKDMTDMIVHSGYLYEVPPASPGTITLAMRVDAIDDIAEGTYTLNAEYVAEEQDIFVSAKRALATSIDTISVFPFTQQCVLVCTAPKGGNPHAGARIKSVGPNLDGVKANIQCQWGNLCCGDNCGMDTLQFSNIYIGLVRDNPIGDVNKRSQIVCGYETISFRRSEDVFHCRFTETVGNVYPNYDDYDYFDDYENDSIPIPGTIAAFELRFNNSTSPPRWEAVYDGMIFDSTMLRVLGEPADTLWQYAKGEWLEVMGEISSLETDMAGTKNNPVTIYDIAVRYSSSLDWDSVNFDYNPDFPHSDNEKEWMALVVEGDVDVVKVWDVKLQAP